MRIRNVVSLLAAALLFLSATACGHACPSYASSGDDDDDGAGPPEREPAVEEADLYRLDGNTLYVYSYSKGLSVIDVTVPASPLLLGEVALTGPAGEVYAESGNVAIVLEAYATSCQQHFGPDDLSWSGELVTVDASVMPPAISSRTCVAGTPVASRKIGDRLFLVTSDEWGERSWVMEIDLTNPATPALSDILELEGGAREVHLGDALVLYVAQPIWDANYEAMTRVRIIDLDGADDGVVERSELTVAGAPQGRFHMDEDGTHFRIVTFDEWNQVSMLHVIDVANPAAPFVAGSLDDIAPGERLYATRFDGKRAYVVTFLQTDPLWVIDMSIATAPTIAAGLVVPGWSDYIFPRGDRLLAVGRGQNGGVGLSLFDVADIQAPATLAQLEFGGWGASSEASLDFRGIGILEAGTAGENPLIALPVNAAANWNPSTSTYDCTNELHIVSLEGDGLVERGALTSSAMVRRSIAIGGKLYAISDVDVSAVDLANLDAPQVLASIEVGDGAALQPQCPISGWGGEGWGDDMGGCY